MKRGILFSVALLLTAPSFAGELIAPGQAVVKPNGQLAPSSPMLTWRCDHPKLMLKMRSLAVGERIVITDANLKPTPVYAEGVEPQGGQPTVVIDNRITCQPLSSGSI